MQHIMADRVLPAVKRYSIGVQPVREAARVRTSAQDAYFLLILVIHPWHALNIPDEPIPPVSVLLH